MIEHTLCCDYCSTILGADKSAVLARQRAPIGYHRVRHGNRLFDVCAGCTDRAREGSLHGTPKRSENWPGRGAKRAAVLAHVQANPGRTTRALEDRLPGAVAGLLGALRRKGQVRSVLNDDGFACWFPVEVSPSLAPRTRRLVDIDYRREPKTERYCIHCQRDVGASARLVYVLDIETNDPPPEVVHPEDLGLFVHRLSEHLIGTDCAVTLGLEWSLPLWRGWSLLMDQSAPISTPRARGDT